MHHHKGSLWRKWDLHFHTPASFDYQDKGVTNQQIIDGLVAAGIRVVAITDHHVIDVERIQELQELGKGRITVLPGIELRSELGGSETVHYIGIFSEDCNLKYIWGKLRNSLNLTKEDIKKQGGDERVWVSIWDAADAIHEHGGLVSIHGGHKSNSIENVSNATLFQRAIKRDLLKKGTVDILEVGRPDDANDYEKIVFPAIKECLPVIICSDNHKISNYRLRSNCWFRADPSFYGLRQTLVEPQDRIYIGEKPEKRVAVAKNRTHYIRSVGIRRKDNSSLKDVWFKEISLDLNHDLVAIIGNKGSGKSALAEIIGLLGNTYNENSFSFLSLGRFRDPKNNLAEHFEAVITWENDHATTPISLNDRPDLNYQELVKCIPQGLFEDICNDIEAGSDNKFNQELRKVIFSHVPLADRLRKDSLDALIAHLTDETNDAIEILKSQLRNLNEQIVSIEDQITSEYREKLTNRLQGKRKELETHDEIKPAEVEKPADRGENNEISTQISELGKKQTVLDSKIEEAKEQEKEQAILETSAGKILDSISNFETQYQNFRNDLSPDLEKLGLTFDSVISLQINRTPVEQKRADHKQKREAAAKLADPNLPESPASQAKEVRGQIETLQGTLDEPHKLYEAYRTQLREWEESRKEIVGSEDKTETLVYYEKQLERLEQLPAELQKHQNTRTDITKQIYEKILSLVEIYRQLYTPVQTFSETYEIAKEAFDLQFDVSVVDRGLEDSFFDWIGRNVAGSFYGSEGGTETLKRIVGRHDFNKWAGVEAFLTDLMEHLRYDKRQSKESQTRVTDQLRKGKSVAGFYDFIYSLDYLRPRYVLKLDGKELSQLSPGERGALLLIFYLLVDKAEIPLIIDQPEENLDNQTVYKHLVGAIKKAKKRRQIIVVTHNPNLAVVCDAEQVICCSIDKKDGNRIEYYSGAIENPEINRRIVDILEGTKPALTNRWRKYAPFAGMGEPDDE